MFNHFIDHLFKIAKDLFNNQLVLHKKLSLFMIIASFGLGCSIKDRPGEVGEDGSVQERSQGAGIAVNTAKYIYPKDMFYKKDGTRKTFLCGWADFDGTGQFGSRYVSENYSKKFACNVQFKLTETHLQALLIDPNVYSGSHDDSKISDKWINIMEFKVKHYFKENQYSPTGRKLNKVIYTTESYFKTKSEWFDAPYVKIEFNSFVNNQFGSPFFNMSRSYIEDIEVEQGADKKTYLAFTTVGDSQVFASMLGFKTRYNFLEIEPTKGFKKQYYNKENSSYVYPIFTIGRYNKNLTKEFYVSKWALDDNKPVDLVVNNWPSEYMDIVYESVRQWNEALTQAKYPNQKSKKTIEYFKVSDKKTKFNFDLRYSSITWIDDDIKSAYGPLGVAMVNPDIMTGEIKWGNSNVYGGLLDKIVNSSIGSISSPDAIDISMVLPPRYKNGAPLSTYQHIEKNLPFKVDQVFSSMFHSTGLESFDESQLNPLGSLFSSFNAEDFKNGNLVANSSSLDLGAGDYLKSFIDINYGTPFLNPEDEGLNEELINIDELLIQASEISISPVVVGDSRSGHFSEVNNLGDFYKWNFGSWKSKIAAAIDQTDYQISQGMQSSEAFFDLSLEKLIFSDSQHIQPLKPYEIAQSHLNLDYGVFSEKKPWLSLPGNESLAEIYSNINALNENIDQRTLSEFFGKTLESRAMLEKEHGSNLTSPFMSNEFDRDRTIENFVGAGFQLDESADAEAVKRVLIKEVLLHELGHFVGLGHNFKSNILPDEFHPITGERKVPTKIYHSLHEKAEGENGHKPHTNMTAIMGYPSMETVVGLKEEHVGPGFQDVQNLTYIYSNTYPIYNSSLDSYEYLPVPNTLKIPSNNAYLPHCGDWWVMYGMDPLCARFDRGHEPVSIVQNEIKKLIDRVDAIQYPNTDIKSGQIWNMERMLWHTSFSTVTRVRRFYDYMRLTFKDSVFADAFDKSTGDYKYLLRFSNSCVVKYEARKSGRVVAANDQIEEFWFEKFDENPKLLDLCYANKIVLDLFKEGIIEKDDSEYNKLAYGDMEIAVPFNGAYFNDPVADFKFSDYREMTLFPAKYASIFSLLNSFPFYLSRGRLVPFFQYADEASFFEYKYLYPYEYVDTVSSNALKALNLSKDKTKQNLEDLRVRREAIAFGSLSSQWGNDNLSVPSDFTGYINDIVGFSSITPGFIILTKKEKDDAPTKVSHFTGTFYNFRARESITIPDIYLLKDTRVIAKINDNTVIYPISKIVWVSDKVAISFGIYTTNTNNDLNPFSSQSVASKLTREVNDYYRLCIEGTADTPGLQAYFKAPEAALGKKSSGGTQDASATGAALTTSASTNINRGASSTDASIKDELTFEGFEVGPNISIDDTVQDVFVESVRQSFEKFYGTNSTEQAGEFKEWWNGKNANYVNLPNSLHCEMADRAGAVGIVGAGALTWSWAYSGWLYTKTVKRGR